MPSYLSNSYPLDVAEGIYWGREWQWGYYKHPPLSSWILYGFYKIFGSIGPYLLSQLTIILTLWLVYLLGKRIMSPERSALGSLLLLAIFYYVWPTLEFNHNIAQFPIWAGILYSLHLSIFDNRLRHWLLLGVLAGLGMLVKYFVAVLLVVAILFSLGRSRRHVWKTAGPWLALLLATLIFLPNLLWLIQNNWLPFTYAEERSALASQGNPRLKAIQFLAVQVLNHIPLLSILVLTRTRLYKTTEYKEGLNFLLFMGLTPALLLFAIGLVFGVGLLDMWGMPMWNLSGLIVVALIPQALFAVKSPRILKGLSIWLILVTICMMVYVYWGGKIRHKPSRMDWPQAMLAQHVQNEWDTLSQCPLDNISGDRWLASIVAAELDGPSVMMAGSPAYSPWMNTQRLQTHGSFAIWQQKDNIDMPLLDNLPISNDMVIREGVWQISWKKTPKRQPLEVKWRAYIPSSCLKSS